MKRRHEPLWSGFTCSIITSQSGAEATFMRVSRHPTVAVAPSVAPFARLPIDGALLLHPQGAQRHSVR